MYGKVLLAGTTLAGVIALGMWWANTPHASGPGAVALQAQLEETLGIKSPGLVVTPAFDHYIVRFFPDRIAGKDGAERRFFFTGTPWQVDLTPLQSGLWQVEMAPQEIFAKVVIRPEGVTPIRSEIRAKGYAFAGIYDESLAFLRTWQSAYAVVEMAQSGGQPLPAPDTAAVPEPSRAPVRMIGYHATGNTVAGETGLDLMIDTKSAGMTQEMLFPTGAGPVSVPLQSGPSEGHLTLTGLRWNRIVPLIARMQALAGPDAETAMLALAKDAAAAMPLFTSLDSRTAVTDLQLDLPPGPARVARFGLRAGLSGSGAEAAMTCRVDVEGFAPPEAGLPGWAGPLVPRDMTLDLGTEGFDLMAFMRQALLAVVQGRGVQPADLMKSFPAHRASVTLAPSRITGAGYQLDMTGRMAGPIAARRTQADVAEASISLRGMDTILSALAAAPADVAAGTMMLGALRGLAETDETGLLHWQLKQGADGMLEVNGMPLGALLR